MKALAVLALFAAILLPARADLPPLPPKEAPLGIALWVFNRFTFTEAVEKAHKLGFRYVQAYARQRLGGEMTGTFETTMDGNTRKQIVEFLKKNNVELVSVSLNAKDDQGWRDIFQLGKDLGAKDITCEPKPADIPLLDKLSKEFGLTCSIYNHFANLDDRLAQLEPYGKNMGLCADTGRWQRAGVDSVEFLKKAQPRLIALNLRDMDSLTKEAHSVVWGTGVGNMAAQIAEIKRQHFTGIVYIQFDTKGPELEDDVKKCQAFYKQEMAKP